MKYRNLEIGEVIQEGDEVLQDDEWQNVSLSIGDEVFIRYVFRRPLAPEQVANIFRERLADLMEEFGVDYISVDVVTNFYFRTKEGELPIYLDWGTLSPGGIRESITSPETGATTEL